MLSPFFSWFLKCCNIPMKKVLLPFYLKKNKGQHSNDSQSSKTRFCVGFYPMLPSLHLTASCWHARSLPVVGNSDVVHTPPMHCSYTSCLGCLHLSSLIIMGINGYIREISPFPPNTQDRDGPSVLLSPGFWDQEGWDVLVSYRTSWNLKQRTLRGRQKRSTLMRVFPV